MNRAIQLDSMREAIVGLLFQCAISKYGQVVHIVRDKGWQVKRTLIPEFRSIAEQLGLWIESEYNASLWTYKINNWIFRFRALDSQSGVDCLRSLRGDITVLQTNELKNDIFDVLQLRTDDMMIHIKES